MITGESGNKVNKIWGTFWTGGSIVELFKDKTYDDRRMMGIVADINMNSEEVI